MSKDLIEGNYPHNQANNSPKPRFLPVFYLASAATSCDEMPLALAWERLIRFIATDGRVLRGELLSCQGTDLDPGRKSQDAPLEARVLSGNDIYDVTGMTKLTDEIVTVKKLLGPLTQEDVPIIRCIGLNYATHSKHISALFLQSRKTFASGAEPSP